MWRGLAAGARLYFGPEARGVNQHEHVAARSDRMA